MAKNKSLPVFLSFFGWLIWCSFHSDTLRKSVKKIYDAEVGVREKTNHNDGARVETYLHYCGLDKGNPWCASFVCWVYGQASVNNPRSGYCPDVFNKKHDIYLRGSASLHNRPKRGDVWGIYFRDKNRVAHVGFVDDWGVKYVVTVEGNTNDAGSREGDGVYKKRRPLSSIFVVADYVNIK